MDNNKSPIMVRVLCNPDTIQTIAVTCRCGLRQLVQIPKELHDSQMAAVIECPRCETTYVLHEHKLHRIDSEKENKHGRRQTGPRAERWTKHYDA